MRSHIPSRVWLAIVIVVLLPQARGSAQAARAAGPIDQHPVRAYTLPNGLTVILAPDHSTPTVAVDVLYHVGSKNEVPGRTGFAHMFEHVMFTGSGHVPYGMHDKFTEGVGGGNNGSTTNDCTQLLRDRSVELSRDARSGSRPTAWASCSTRSTRRSSRRSATS